MSFEAVPCVFKSRDETGKEAPMFGLIIRRSGQQSTSTSSLTTTTPISATNGNSTTIQNATTAIPIAPVTSLSGSQTPAQIQIIPSTSASSSAPKLLKPIRTGLVSKAALLAAARSADPSTILRPVATSGSNVFASFANVDNSKTVVAPSKTPTQIAKSTSSKKSANKKKESPPTIHNFCNDLPPSDKKEVPSFETPSTQESSFESNLQPVNAYKEPYPIEGKASTSSSQQQANVQPTMNESALEDLNSIEMNQLLTNTSTINTEDYLDQTMGSNMDFYVGSNPSTSTPNTSSSNQFNYPSTSSQIRHSSTTHLNSPMPSTSGYHPHQIPTSTNNHYQQQQMEAHKYSNYYPHHSNPQAYQNPIMHQQQPLLQPIHSNNPHSSHHPHYHQGLRPSTSYSYNNHHMPQVDHRRIALMNGVHPPGSNHLSTSPDSGIQSIDGSPPSTFTPPMVSPYTIQTNNYDHHHEAANNYQQNLNHCPPSCSAVSNPVVSVQSTIPNEDEDDDDFSDMPTLTRADQVDQVEQADQSDLMERPESSATTKPESVTNNVSNNSSSRSNSRASTSMTNNDETAGIIAITPGMDLTEFAERLASTMDPEKLKQFTSIIQSKVNVAPKSSEPIQQQVEEEPKIEALQPTTTANIPSTSSSFKTPSKSPKAIKENKPKKRQNDENLNQQSTSKRSDKNQPKTKSSSKPNKYHDDDEDDEKEESSISSRKRQQREQDEEAMKNERLRMYRQKVEQKLKARLAQLIVQIGTEFSNIHLNLGKPHQFPLPWKSPDWKAVEQRCQTKDLKRKSLEGADVETKRPKLENESQPKLEVEEVIVKKNRGRPRQKPPQLEVQAPLKRKPGRPIKKPKLIKEDGTEAETEKSTQQNLLQVPTQKENSKSPVNQRRKRSKNKNDFVKIRSNVFIDSPPRLPESKKCNCTLSNPCVTRNCLHRANFEECTQATCQWHEQCHNRRMGNNEAIHHLQIFDTENCEKGVRSATEIHPGQFICEFVGEVVKYQNYQLRTLLRSEDMPRFGIHVTNEFVVDATQRGNIARFINHSCEPNCEMQKWIVNGYYRLGIFAKKKIEEGDELTYDYSMFAKLEPNQKCECGSKSCKGFIPYQSVPNTSFQEEPQQLDKHQTKIIRKNRILLMRNLRKFERKVPNRSAALCKKYPELSSFLLSLYESVIQHAETKEHVSKKRLTQLCITLRRLFKMNHKTADILAERFDDILKHWINSLYPCYERRAIETLKSHYIHLKKTRDVERHCPKLLAKETVRSFIEDRKRPHSATKRESHRVLSAEADLSYINSGCLIGSYNPDERVNLSEKNDESDSVRCICGITEDDGNMVLCDHCNFWMHADCVSFDASNNEEFECDFCKNKYKHTPAVDIVLKPQPEFNFPGCTYYRTLNNSRGLQVRINEAVYVERLINDDYKAILKSMHEECAQAPKKRGRKAKNPTNAKDQTLQAQSSSTKAQFSRQDVRHFRVERLFVSPQGQRFVFGCYYARPHETFCDSTRLFHKNEVFWTPMFDTLPLDAVIGRCLILEPVNWVDGRPRVPKYKEEDVFVCEYQIDKNQRTFTKIQPNNHYYLNTAPYAFEKFAQKRELKKNFTPFVLGASNTKMVERSESREKVQNAAKELSSMRLNLVWKQILSANNLNAGQFRCH